MSYSQTAAMKSTESANRGFTLIELMIVLAIIGILSAIAYPQYGAYVQKTRRSDAHSALLQEVQNLERCRAVNYSYANCALLSATSPEDYYDITLQSDASSYTLTATAKGTQLKDTKCTVMTMNQQSARTPDSTSGCWPN